MPDDALFSKEEDSRKNREGKEVCQNGWGKIGNGGRRERVRRGWFKGAAEAEGGED